MLILARMLIVVLCFLLLTGNCRTEDRTQSAIPITGEELQSLKQTLLARYDGITSIAVTYRVTNQHGYGSHHIVRQLGKLRRVENRHFGFLPETLDLNHTIQFYDGRTLDVFNVNACYFETSLKNARLPYMWKVRVDTYVTSTGWWLDENESPPDNRQFCLFYPVRAMLASKSLQILRSTETQFNKCVILRAEGHSVWVDPRYRYAVVRREVSIPAVDVNYSRFVELTNNDGVSYWFPHQIHYHFYGGDGNANSRQIELEVESLKIDQLGPEQLRAKLPPGTLIQDRDTAERYLVPGGRKILDNNIQLAAQFRELIKRQRRNMNEK